MPRLLLMLVVVLAFSQRGMSAPDVIWTNAKIYTVSDKQAWADGLALTGKTISYVGDSATVLAMAGPDTEVRDLGGKLVLPGFIDSHMHIGDTIPYMSAVELTPDMTAEEVIAVVKAHAISNPDQNPVMGRGFLASAFGELGPTAVQLDEAVPNRPAFILDEGVHSAWINSKAMGQIGLNAQSPDPVPGAHYFQRYPDGRPTGWLVEGGAFQPVAEQLGVFDPKRQQAGADSLFSIMSAMGITAVFDAGFISNEQQGMEFLHSQALAGRLPLRIVASHYVNTPALVEGAVARVQQYQDKYQHERFDVRVLKLSLDGTVEARTAFLLEDYLGRPGDRGQPLIPPDTTRTAVLEAAELDMDVHIHALGDGAVSLSLDMVADARRLYPASESRFTLCHLQVVSPKDVARFGQLRVMAQSTPAWYAFDDVALEFLGEPRFSGMYPLQGMAGGGARLTFGSDYPATWIGQNGLAPLFNIEMAITRQPPGDTSTTPQPDIAQRVSLQQAIKAYTLDAAYQLRLEDQIGSIEAGKRADLVVLDTNIFELPSHQIHQATVLETWLEGEAVFGGR